MYYQDMKFKDPFSGFSHLIGTILAIIGTILLLLNSKSIIETISFLIFGLTMIILYTNSAMYHLFGESADKISLLRKLDHASIYFLIAGTFAPFCLVLINNVLGWSVFASVCILAIIGACLSFIKSLWSLPRWLLTSFYVFIGLIGIILIYPLRIYPEIIKWIIIGGAFYLIGAIIYTIKKPNLSKAFGFHELFHLFILGGTFSHFFCIYQFIALN